MSLVEERAARLKIHPGNVEDLMKRFPYWVDVREDLLLLGRSRARVPEPILDKVLSDHRNSSHDWFLFKTTIMFTDSNYALAFKIRYG